MIQDAHNLSALLTAFRNSSAEFLLKDIKGDNVLFLPNDKRKDSEKLIDVISRDKLDYVISFGQRPNIKNKVHIETTARSGEIQLNTGFDCEALKRLLEQNGIVAKVSHNAGTSFCNALYFNGLKYILENGLDTQMVFLHIPYRENIDDIDGFRKQIVSTLQEISCYCTT